MLVGNRRGRRKEIRLEDTHPFGRCIEFLCCSSVLGDEAHGLPSADHLDMPKLSLATPVKIPGLQENVHSF